MQSIPGGQIGASDEFTTRRDVSLVKHAIKGRWPIRPSTRVKIVEQTEKILDDPNADPSLKLLASRTFIQMDALNLREDELKLKAMPQHHIHTNMTTDELKATIKDKLATLGLDNLPQEALADLIQNKPLLAVKE